MKQLAVNFTKEIGYQSAMDDITLYLGKLAKQQINELPWSAHPYRPKTAFAIAHSGDCIFLQYDVNERSIRAVQTEINSAVWEDSCVEFFIAFTDRGYYNFEFNCAGTPLLGFGAGKAARELLPEDVVRKIKIYSVITEETAGSISWTLTVAIPLEVFVYDGLLSIKKRTGRANFYKCGDLLPEPHFLSWNNIQNCEPNFHLPEYFGTLNFE